MSAVIDFQNDLKETTLQFLNKKKDDLPHLLIKLYTFLNKYIAPQVRRVSYSKELISKVSTLPEATQQALSKMEQWVSIGVDVNAFQSRGLYGEGSRDYQNAFYEMVHLHLSAKKDDVTPVLVKGRFAKPSDYLLFAIFKQGEAFFVDVVQHPQALSKKNPRVITWTTSDLLKILEKNWPSLVEPMRIPGLSGSNSKKGALLDMIRPSSITLGCAAEAEFEKSVKKHCEEEGIPLYKMQKDTSQYRLYKVALLEFDK